MTPIKITLHNFLSYIDPKPLDFSRFDLAVLSGENGAGKSSIFEALTWAVWEKTRASSSEDLIHQGSQEMWVDFVFSHEDAIYRIFRRRDKRKQGASALEFQIKDTKKDLLGDEGWKSISEGTIRVTQEKIIKNLKLPYEIFVNSSYIRQGHADEFTIKTPAERKEILSEILGLGDWSILEEKAKEKIRVLENENQNLSFQIEDLKNQVSQKASQEKELKIVQHKKDALTKKLLDLEKEFKKVNDKKLRIDLINQKVESLREKVADLNLDIKRIDHEIIENTKEINNYSSIVSKKEKINASYLELKRIQESLDNLEEKRERFHALQQELATINYQERDLEKKTLNIKNISTCPTCLRPLKNKEAKEIVDHLREEFQKKVLPKKQKIEQVLKSLGYNETIFRKLSSKRQELSLIEEDKRALDIADTNINNFKKQNQKILLEKKGKLKLREKIITEGMTLAKEVAESQKIKLQWEKLDHNVQNSRDELLSIESSLGGLGQTLKEIARHEKSLAENENKLKVVNKERGVLDTLVIAFGKKGIQAMIIEQSLPLIEEEANRILEKASSGKMRIKFISQRAKKTDEEEMIETLDIKVADTEGERNYEMYSGGEAFRINFSIRVALSKFLASRSGVHLKFLVMDEGFGTLDAAGKEALVEAINSIRGEFEKIIIITHIQELKDLFPTQISVTKGDLGSQIEVVG